ncbi:MAG: hypothetical protein QXX03_05555 [Nitrososphaerota archaeon]
MKEIFCIHMFKIIDGNVIIYKCRKLQNDKHYYTCLEAVGRECPAKRLPDVNYLPYLIEYKGIKGIYYKKIDEEI